MKFSEIAHRVSGFSTPVFGDQCNPPKAEVTKADRPLAFLESRLVFQRLASRLVSLVYAVEEVSQAW